MTHRFALRVYYEDTDFGGVVYYANYLKFIERARSEWARARGLNQARLKAEEGVVFVVRRIEADYLRPGRFDDWLVVLTRADRVGGASLTLAQEVRRGEEILFAATVVLVALGPDGRAVRLPAVLREAPP